VYNTCAQRYAHKYEQFLYLCLVRVRLVFVFFLNVYTCSVCSVGKGLSKGIVCMFVGFCVFLCVSLDYFGFVLLVSFLGLFFYQ